MLYMAIFPFWVLISLFAKIDGWLGVMMKLELDSFERTIFIVLLNLRCLKYMCTLY